MGDGLHDSPHDPENDQAMRRESLQFIGSLP